MRPILVALVAAMLVAVADRASGAEPDNAPIALTFEVVAAPGGGETVVAGTAAPGATVEILDRDRPVAMAVANRRGEWAISLSSELPPGAHRLAVRAIAADRGEAVIADRRIEVVIASPPPAAGSDAARLPDRVVVTPGDNLWVIARRLYGSGSQYERLFEANRGVISHPRAIFPGQVLSVPRAPNGDG